MKISLNTLSITAAIVVSATLLMGTAPAQAGPVHVDLNIGIPLPYYVQSEPVYVQPSLPVYYAQPRAEVYYGSPSYYGYYGYQSQWRGRDWHDHRDGYDQHWNSRYYRDGHHDHDDHDHYDHGHDRH